MILTYDKINTEISKLQSNLKTLDFDCQIEDKSFKICITRNYQIMDDDEVFGVEINIFNDTLDYSLINYAGEIVEHNYYKKFDLDNFFILLDKTISTLTKDQKS